MSDVVAINWDTVTQRISTICSIHDRPEFQVDKVGPCWETQHPRKTWTVNTKEYSRVKWAKMLENETEITGDWKIEKLCLNPKCISPVHHAVVSTTKGVWTEDDFDLLEFRLLTTSKVSHDLAQIELNTRLNLTPLKCRNSELIANDTGRISMSYRCQRMKASRWAYLLKMRLLPTFDFEENQVLHKCGNQDCIEADHLQIGTRSENERDKILHSTSGHGKHSNLTIEQARMIKLSKGSGSQAERALKYGVTIGVVYTMDTGKAWNWLSQSPEQDNKFIAAVVRPKLSRNPTTKEEFEKGAQMIKDAMSSVDGWDSQDKTKCWIWPRRQENGYGRCSLLGKVHRANVLSYKCANHISVIPPKLQVAHSCGKSLCVNSSHLRLDTGKGNCADKKTHGTLLFGETHPKSKLTEAQVREIKTSVGITQRVLGEKYGVTSTTISAIIRGKKWSHITVETRTQNTDGNYVNDDQVLAIEETQDVTGEERPAKRQRICLEI